MKLKSLYIRKCSDTLVNIHRLNEGLNIIKTADVDTVKTALRCLLGLPYEVISDDRSIEMLAAVKVKDEEFAVEAHLFGWWEEEDFEVQVREYRAKTDSNCTAEYFDLIRQNGEANEMISFDTFMRGGYPHCLRAGKTEIFRRYRNRFISEFKPIRLRDDKPYVLSLAENGVFTVRHEKTGEAVSLSETEMMLYHLRCFYQTVAFWSGERALRCIDPIDKPLIVDGLFERTDDALDRQPFLDLMAQSGRQTILLMPQEHTRA